MALVKNISGAILSLDDIGFELEIDEVLDLNDIDSDELSSSIDLANAVTLGSLVYLEEDGVTEKTIQESQTIQESNSQGIDLSDYVKITDIQTMINDAIALIPSGDTNVNDIIGMPSFLVKYDKLRFNTSNNSGSSDFYKRLGFPYYINQSVTTKQVITDIQGSGYLTGIMLPVLRDKDVVDRRVEVIITIDGVETREQFIYSDDNDNKYRIFIGSGVGDRYYKFTLTEDDDNENFITSDRKPMKHGLAESIVHIAHPTIFIQDDSLPKMKFNSSLKVEYVLNQVDMFNTSNYKNRAISIYNLGDF